MAMSDFIAPVTTGAKDYLGMFACSAGFGCDVLAEKYEKKELDDYKGIMIKAIADRFAEAMAERMHEEMRRVYWGYAKNETLEKEDLLQIKYQGIRPAPGYPSQPDHTEKATMWKLMDVTAQTGIELSESLVMLPAASVSALCFSHKKSQYFAVGKVTKDQITEYAGRKKMPVEEIEKWLSSTLAYDNDLPPLPAGAATPAPAAAASTPSA